MSSQRVTYGLVAVLKTALNNEKREDLYDILSDAGLQISYDGKLVFMHAFNGDPWDAEFVCGKKQFGSKKKFKKLCTEHDLEIDSETIDVFYANWYDGCDSPMAMMTIEEFLGEE